MARNKTLNIFFYTDIIMWGIERVNVHVIKKGPHPLITQLRVCNHFRIESFPDLFITVTISHPVRHLTENQ